MAKTSKKRSGGGSLLLGLLLGILLTVAAVFVLLHFTSVPVTLLGRNGRQETLHVPITTRMAKVAEDAPFSPSEDVFEAGAHTYAAKCAGCHGSTRHSAAKGLGMHPAAGQFWTGKAKNGLGRKTSREVYDLIAEGNLSNGMPAYSGQLSDTEIWQLALLLKSSDLELPDPVRKILASGSSN